VRAKEREREFVTQPSVIDFLNYVLLRYGTGDIPYEEGQHKNYSAFAKLEAYGYIRDAKLTRKAIKLLQEVSNG